MCKTFNELHGFIYEVLTGITINYTILFFDFRKSDFKNYYELIERLVLRQMGVLLKHKNDRNLKRKIVTKMSQNQNYRDFFVTPEYPTIQVPPLIELLYGENDESITATRYELLAWIVSDKITGLKLQDIPEIYLPDILVLIYLLEVGNLFLI